MKINMSLDEVKEAICHYLRNELSLRNVSADDVEFKNARSIEDISYVINIGPKKDSNHAEVERKSIVKGLSSETQTTLGNAREPEGKRETGTEARKSETGTRCETSITEGTTESQDNGTRQEKEPEINTYSSVFGNLKN